MPLKNFTILGLDIGGANIKIAKLEVMGKRIIRIQTTRRYFPIWIRGKEALPKILGFLKRNSNVSRKYYVSLTMTAELSDVYRVKREGVKHVMESVAEVFSDSEEIFVLNVKGELVKFPEALSRDPMEFAASNWVASGLYIGSSVCKNCIFVDIGSTSTTVVPIVEGKLYVRGLRDPEKLVYGELVYLGFLRTNVSTVVNVVPYKGYFAKVSSEKFALMGDVVRILGYITEQQYSTETADGRGKSIRECWERLSRIVCADAEILSLIEVVEIAKYIYEKAIEHVFDALMQVRTRLLSENIDLKKFEAIVAGVGEKLAIEALKRAGFKNIRKLSDILGKRISNVFPAYALAILTLDKVLSL